MKIILTGATGMIGEGILIECLNDPRVQEILSVSRKPSGKSHPKLSEYIVPEFLDLSENDTKLQGYDACFFCAGVSSVGMEKPLYEKISTYLAKGFSGHPTLTLPTKDASRIFEWRTYEAYNEDALKRKIAMFNDEELKIFDTVGLHNVFFGEVLAGENTPCLSYMVSFENMAERDANWAKFGADPDWKRISGDAKYANSHSRTVRKFLEPTSYSQW